jgi:hypothetical protein
MARENELYPRQSDRNRSFLENIGVSLLCGEEISLEIRHLGLEYGCAYSIDLTGIQDEKIAGNNK